MKRILIVEDNQILSENFSRIFRGEFEIFRAENAAETIEILDRTTPDLILLDILLQGHSAFAILNEIRGYSDTVEIPVVICSDLAENLDGESLKNYGVRAVFDKSTVRPSELKRKCLEIVGE